MAALAGTDVPVPPLVGYEPDPSVLGAPFYVMAEMEGDAPPDLPPFTKTGWVLELPPSDQASLYERSIAMLARVHRLDVATLDVGHLASGFDEQLVRAERWFRWAVEDRDNLVLEATLTWLHKYRPAPGPAALGWGDARIGNMLYRDLEPVAVLDWEMAAVGPAEVDLGWWLFLNRHHTDGLGVPRLSGFPDDETTVAMWSEAVGRPAGDVFYYDVFAGFRFGIIVGRASRRMIEDGTLPEEQSFERVNGATTLLAQMLDLPIPEG
jgi:aminoglycoside phosphotransferase (APT) family kinase protein